MRFNEALNLMCDGQKVTRPEWGEGDYGLIQDNRLRIYMNGEFYDWILSYGDLLPEDWELA